MYEGFSDEARELLQLTNLAAQRWKHEYIGTEHILLGLVQQGESVATRALKKLGVDPESLRKDLERLLQPGPCVVGVAKLPQTLRAKKAIEHAVGQARHWHDSPVSSGHILIGLLREQEGVAAQVLMNRGVTLPMLLAAILDLQRGTLSTRVSESVRQDSAGPPPEKGRSPQFAPAASGVSPTNISPIVLARSCSWPTKRPNDSTTDTSAPSTCCLL